jgi:hypothetical protein
MKRIIIALILTATLGCESANRLLNPAPEPTDYSYHLHTVRLFVKTINRNLDTLHLQRARLPLTFYTYSRPPVSNYDNCSYLYQLPETVFVNILNPDTSVVRYDLPVRHCVQYQLNNHTDTTRFAKLDTINGWKMDIYAAHENVVTGAGDSLFVFGGLLPLIPDTIRSNGTTDVDVTFNMSGLYTITHFGNNQIGLDFNSTCVTYRQR